jgi:hypothetical protein
MKKIILVVFIASLLCACNNDVKHNEVNEEIVGTSFVTSVVDSTSCYNTYHKILYGFKGTLYKYAERDSFTFYKTSDTKEPYTFIQIFSEDFAVHEVYTITNYNGDVIDTPIVTEIDFTALTNKYELKLEWYEKDGELIGKPVAMGFYLKKSEVDSTIDTSVPKFWIKYEDIEKYYNSYFLDFINKALFLGTLTYYSEESYFSIPNHHTNEIDNFRAFSVSDEDQDFLYKIRNDALKSDDISFYKTDSVFVEPDKYNVYTKEEAKMSGGERETIELELEDGYLIDTTIYTEVSKDQLVSFAVSEVWEHDVENNQYIKKENRAFAIVFRLMYMNRSYERSLFWLKPDDLKSILSEEEYQKVLEAVDNSLIK